MVLSPTFGVRNVHLVAQNVPYHAGLLPHFKRFDGCQTVQSIKHLVACERAAIATAEYLFKQLPKFTFLHAPKCTQQAQPKENARRNKPPGVRRPTGIRLRRNRDNRRPCAASAPWRCPTIAQSSSAARSWPLFGHAPLRRGSPTTLRPFRSPHATFCGHGCADRAVHGRWPREAIPLWVRRCHMRVNAAWRSSLAFLAARARSTCCWANITARRWAGVSSLTRALPLCTVGTIALSSICSLVSVIVSMPPAPFAFHTYVHYGQHPYSWIIPVKVLKESSVFPEYIARFRAARLPDHPSDAAHKQLFDAHECH